MRLIAYAILIFGFVWICFLQLEIRPITRSVLMAQANRIPKKESYTREDVLTAIHDTAVDMADRVPSVPSGGLIMLGGALILDRAIRRKRVHGDTA